MYNSFSLWDTYRALHPLMALLHPSVSKDFAASLLAMDDAWGSLPLWPALSSDGDMMTGDGASIVLTDLALQGLVDVKAAYDAVPPSPFTISNMRPHLLETQKNLCTGF